MLGLMAVIRATGPLKILLATEAKLGENFKKMVMIKAMMNK